MFRRCITNVYISFKYDVQIRIMLDFYWSLMCIGIFLILIFYKAEKPVNLFGFTQLSWLCCSEAIKFSWIYRRGNFFCDRCASWWMWHREKFCQYEWTHLPDGPCSCLHCMGRSNNGALRSSEPVFCYGFIDIAY